MDPDAILNDVRFIALPPLARAAYLTLLLAMRRASTPGMVPDDDDVLASLSMAGASWSAVADAVRPMFAREGGLLIAPAIVEQAAREAATTEAKQAGGMRSAARRRARASQRGGQSEVDFKVLTRAQLDPVSETREREVLDSKSQSQRQNPNTEKNAGAEVCTEQVTFALDDDANEPADWSYCFDRFWTEYPRKVAKVVARKAWDRIGPQTVGAFESIERALAAAKRSEQWTRDEGRFIPHPATWLHQRRWEDGR